MSRLTKFDINFRLFLRDIYHFFPSIGWKILKPIFFSFDPEKVHHFVVRYLKLSPITMIGYDISSIKSLETEVFGIKFPNPVGLAAGFDKNGTVTPKPQEGNQKTRIFRLTKDGALINRLGFNNDGVEKVIERLKNNKKIIIGGNIGKNKNTPNENAVDDYLFCFQKLYDYVDYFTVNVSSPNTPNLRDLQNIESLKSILIPLIEKNKKKSRKPILLKISPDLADKDIISVVDLIQDIGLDGIISTNTTIKRDKLKSPSNLKNEKGGLSGSPLKKRSTEVISLIHKYSKGKVPIIGVGGIMSAKDAIEKLNAGASLLQVYTGFIYNGPSFAYKINREIIKSLN
jgi:dihydroorotate dehydrogenase